MLSKNPGVITYRPIHIDEMAATYDVFRVAADELARLSGESLEGCQGAAGPFGQEESIWAHLAVTAHEAWLAHDGDRVLGYARTILREDVQTLTELFVRPEAKGRGIGKELLACAFRPAQGRRRLVVASTDPAAVALYLKAALGSRCSIYTFRGPVSMPSMATDLSFASALPDNLDDLDSIGQIDAEVIGHRRDVDHAFLLGDRYGFLARRSGRIVAYGYAGRWTGPMAALDPADIPALLAHAESMLSAVEIREARFSLPLPNRTGVSYLLTRGYRLDPSFVRLMSDVELGQFDRYVCTIPSLLL